MYIKKIIKQLLPGIIKSRLLNSQLIKEVKKINSIDKLDCDTSNLLHFNSISLSEIFNSEVLYSQWLESKKRIDIFNIPDLTGGVNPGDRRILYYLVSFYKPKSVLEIGTHIGASTIHIASALCMNQYKYGINGGFTSLDIRDVNSNSERPWIKYGTKYSPIQMIHELKHGKFVKFVTNTSFKFFETCQDKFDFIFLDGDHTAYTVYQEITMALEHLNTNGIILLHDYFPQGKPLWPDNSVIYGPYLATERYIKEGVDIIVLPLGSLPWATKLNSHYTSLALLLKAD